MAKIDFSKINFNEYKPHPFPNPIGGDIIEVEDDAAVTFKYFLVMAGVLLVLIVLSVSAIMVFVTVLKWRWARQRRLDTASEPPPPDSDHGPTDTQ